MNSNGQTENNEEGEDKTKPGIETGIVLYQSDGANVSVEVMYSDETFWMRQKAIAELFGVGLPTISEHLNNIFKSGELEKTSSTTSFDFSERSRLSGRPPVYYNLDADNPAVVFESFRELCGIDAALSVSWTLGV